ncbi:hypothetical protein ACOBV8_19720 (plasmid) [Pseudoalteromonas espejiana]
MQKRLYTAGFTATYDVAMYRAKSDGKVFLKVYSPEMGNKMRRYHYLLEEELRRRSM